MVVRSPTIVSGFFIIDSMEKLEILPNFDIFNIIFSYYSER